VCVCEWIQTIGLGKLSWGSIWLDFTRNQVDIEWESEACMEVISRMRSVGGALRVVICEGIPCAVTGICDVCCFFREPHICNYLEERRG
jgi:hypothetical protein